MSKRTTDDMDGNDDDDDELTRLKAATADDRYEWMCPICMSPYDNQYRVPMAVSECYAKKRNPYSEEEDRGRADGCGHQVCEICSLRMLEKHMQCAVCRSNIKEFTADTALLADIVAFAEGQYVSMAAQYNEASTRLEPALMDLKKLQDDMAPTMKEAQEARERADKLQAEVNTLKGAVASRDMYQKMYEEEKKKSEAIPLLNDAIDKLQRDLYSLAEEVVYVRLEMVAQGSIDPDHVGLSQTDKALVVEGGPVNDRTCRVEVPVPMFPSKQMTKAIHQIKVINETEHGGVADTAPSDPRHIDRDVITATGREGGGERVFIRVGSWTDRFLREGTGFAERIMDGPDNNNPESGHYFRMVSVHSIKEAKLASEVFTAKKREEQEAKVRINERRAAAMERIRGYIANCNVSYSPLRECIDCFGEISENCGECDECAVLRCEICLNDQALHACRMGSQTNKYGMPCTSGLVAWEAYVTTCRRVLMTPPEMVRFYVDYLFATGASGVSSDRIDVNLDIDVNDMGAVAATFAAIFTHDRMAASSSTNLMKAREFIVDHMVKRFPQRANDTLEAFSRDIKRFYEERSAGTCPACLGRHGPGNCLSESYSLEWLKEFNRTVCRLYGDRDGVLDLFTPFDDIEFLGKMRALVIYCAFEGHDFAKGYTSHLESIDREGYDRFLQECAAKHAFQMPRSCVPVTLEQVRKVVGNSILEAALYKAPSLDTIEPIRALFGALRAFAAKSGTGARNRLPRLLNDLAREAESEYEVSRKKAKRIEKIYQGRQ